MDAISDALPGVDSLNIVGSRLKNGQTLVDAAIEAFGMQPAFWGRYFSSPGKSAYKAPLESPILSANNIRLLPIARQTNNVTKAAAIGTQDAKNNVAALVEAFGEDFLSALAQPLYIVLDVETALSADYYFAWATEIANADFPLAPCAYMPSPPHHAAWKALADAMERGASCGGVWIAWYLSNSPNFAPLPDWDVQKTTQPTRAPTLGWQYMGDVIESALDLSVTSPLVSIQSALLDHLIVPPC